VNGNGNGPPPSSGTSGEPDPKVDPRTADLGDPRQLREVLVSIDETGKAAIGGGFHMAEELRNFRAESATQHRDIAAKVQAIVDVLGPKVQAVSDDMRKGFDSIAEELRTHRRAFDAALSIEAMAREETDKGLHAEIEKVNRREAESRKTINAISGPDVPDLADVTQVRNIPAMVKAQITEHTLEITRGELATAKQAEIDRKRELAEAAKERRARLFALLMLVLGTAAGVLGTLVRDWMK
jgi:hypothetical protein